jgi:hypothetical protein
MAHTYSTTQALINDAARFGLNAVTLVKTGAYRRTASGTYVADLSKAPKTYVL